MGGDLEETSRAQPVRAGPGHLEDGTQRAVGEGGPEGRVGGDHFDPKKEQPP